MRSQLLGQGVQEDPSLDCGLLVGIVLILFTVYGSIVGLLEFFGMPLQLSWVEKTEREADPLSVELPDYRKVLLVVEQSQNKVGI